MGRDNLMRVLSTTSLKTKIFTYLQMQDYQNWHNGSYKGDIKKLQDTANDLVDIVEKWDRGGQPNGFSKF